MKAFVKRVDLGEDCDFLHVEIDGFDGDMPLIFKYEAGKARRYRVGQEVELHVRKARG